MAIAQTIVRKTVQGDQRVVYGTYILTGVTTGDIETGLMNCEFLTLQAAQGTVVADAPTVNETLPKAGGAITIIGTSGSAGYWKAEGK